MGEPDKFYYDQKLGRWLEEGVEPPVEEATLAPPPKGAARSEATLGHGSSEFSSSKSSGIRNSTFSARGRTGVQQRYVSTKLQSPSAAFTKPVAKSNPQIFVPKAVASVDQPVHPVRNNAQQQSATVDENRSPTSLHKQFQPPSYQSSMQRFASMDDISRGVIIPKYIQFTSLTKNGFMGRKY